jgi:16S rRNA (cytosine967-C5)-methyltransferase
LLEAANLHPPMTLRVNARRSTGAAYVQRLQAEGRAAQLLADPALGGQAVVLAQPCAVHLLPGFAQGDVSVQDAAAQRAARLLLGLEGTGVARLPPNARVLDACAAPGGKTAHLLELAELDLLALDSDAQRLTRVHDTLQRLQLPFSRAGTGAGSATGTTLQAADARQTRAWWDGRPFDAILLDAPCTASGIVRRHPDVRWLRRSEDIAALARTQAALLDALWPLLKPGGRLLYASCSLFKAEGEHQVDAFLQRTGAASARLDPASPGHLLPLADNPGSAPGPGAALQDGFFYALLHKAMA